MIKEFEIDDILNAVDSISNIEKKKSKTLEKNDSVENDDVLTLNNQVKSNKSKILVLDQMIE
tara:strand:+ start:370 stop:555 length:186 start_codon:yes stop_codon:yes gene_type:complete